MVVELKPLRIHLEDFEELEKEIKRAFRQELYEPLMRDLLISPSMMMNSRRALTDAIRRGKVRFYLGAFRGDFSAAVTKELKELGAVWDNKAKVFQISKSDLPLTLQSVIDRGEVKLAEAIDRVMATLAKNLPEKITGLIDSVSIFENLLKKTDGDIESTLRNITVAPKLSREARKRVAEEWQGNLDLFIKDFTASETDALRKAVMKSTLAGNRFESLVGAIQSSYGVTERKAHFLARQETNLLLTKYREIRYTEAGVMHYRWRCVVGSPAHPVRPSHLALDGKIFRWDDPPITTAKGEPERRNNPGQDFNCRCMAVPVIL